MSIPKSWEEATQTGSDGSISLSDDWSRTIERKKGKYEIHELYMLVAASDGYFPANIVQLEGFIYEEEKFTDMVQPVMASLPEDIMKDG